MTTRDYGAVQGRRIRHTYGVTKPTEKLTNHTRREMGRIGRVEKYKESNVKVGFSVTHAAAAADTRFTKKNRG